MRKTLLIIRREYISRVRKKSFIIITLLVPFLFVAFIAIEVFLINGGNKDTKRIAVIDNSHLFENKLRDGESIYFIYLNDNNPDNLQKSYQQKGYTGFLYIPKIDLERPSGFTYYGQNQLGFATYEYISGQLNKVIEDQRMLKAGIDKKQLDAIKADVDIMQPASEGGQGSTAVSTAVGYVSGFLIYFILFFFGTQVMRGVMEEKTSRIAEVMISSVKPFQLMMGKILGIAGVGLTQFLIWLVMIILLFIGLGVVAPDMAHQAGQMQMQSSGSSQAAAMAMQKANFVLSTLPVVKIVLCFLFYFLGGYLLYAALFASVGSVVDQDMTESQSLIFPVMLPIILSFFIMVNAIQQPNSPLSVGASIFPLSSPLVMMARIPFGVPWWQLTLSMFLLVLGFIFTTWLAGKIYRTGILLYGKKVTFKEMGKWLFRRN